MQLFSLGDLDVVEVSLVGEGAVKRKIALTKNEGSTSMTLDAVLKTALETECDGETPDLSESAKVALRAIKSFKLTETEKDALTNALNPKVEEMEKDLDPKIQAKLEALTKAAATAEAKQQELEKALDAERKDRELKELIGKAINDFSHVPGKPEEVASLLQKARAAGIDLEPVLKTMNDQLAHGELFKIRGSNSRATEASDELNARIVELRKSNPDLSQEQAYVKVVSADPSLKQRIREEGRS